MCEIHHHALVVQAFGAAVQGDNAVVAVQVAALAGIIEAQLVRIGHLNAFGNVIHGLCRFACAAERYGGGFLPLLLIIYTPALVFVRAKLRLFREVARCGTAAT